MSRALAYPARAVVVFDGMRPILATSLGRAREDDRS